MPNPKITAEDYLFASDEEKARIDNYNAQNVDQNKVYKEDALSLTPSFIVNKDRDKYSDYDVQFGKNLDWEEQRADNQSASEQWGRALANTGSELVLGTLKGVSSIPDVFTNLYSVSQGEIADFENDLSGFLRETMEDISDSNQIHKSNYASEFDMTSNAWWSQNLPSLASAATFILPMAAVSKGVGSLARGSGALLSKTGKGSKWISGLAKAKGLTVENMTSQLLGKVERYSGTVAGAIYSNAAESFQEAVPLAIKYREQMLSEGKSEEEANEVSAKIGRDIYLGNLSNILLELPSSYSMMKGFKNSRQILNKKLTGEFLTEIATESAQEVTNSISSKEAIRTADISTDKLEDDGSSFTERLVDSHLTNGETLTSAFFGGLGGAGFKALQNGINLIDNNFSKDDFSTYQQQRARRVLQSNALQDLGTKNDSEVLHDFGKGKATFELSYNHAASGTSERYENRLKEISENPEALAEFGTSKEEVDNLIRDTRVAEDAYNKSVSILGVKDPSNYNGIDVNRELADSLYQLETSKANLSKYKKRQQDLTTEIREFTEVTGNKKEENETIISYSNEMLKELEKEKLALTNKKNEIKKNVKDARYLNRRTIDTAIKVKEVQIKRLEESLNYYLEDNDKVNKDLNNIDKLPQAKELASITSSILDTELQYALAQQKYTNFSTPSAIETQVSALEASEKNEVKEVEMDIEETNDVSKLVEKEKEVASPKSKEVIKKKINKINTEKSSIKPPSKPPSNKKVQSPKEGKDDFADLDFVPDLDDDFDSIGHGSIKTTPKKKTPSKKPKKAKEVVDKRISDAVNKEADPATPFPLRAGFDPNEYYEVVGETGKKHSLLSEGEIISLVDSEGKIRKIGKAKVYDKRESDPGSREVEIIKDNEEVLTLFRKATPYKDNKKFEEIRSIDRFSKVIIIPKYGNMEKVDKVLSSPNWKDSVRFVASKRFANSYADAKKRTVKERMKDSFIGDSFNPATLSNASEGVGKTIYASNSTVVDIKLQVKDKGTWFDGGDISNPYQWLKATDTNSLGEYVDFTTLSYEDFNKDFKLSRLVNDEKVVRDFTVEEYNTFKTIYGANKNLFDSVNPLVGDSDIDITHFLNTSISGKIRKGESKQDLSNYNVTGIIDTLSNTYIDRDTDVSPPLSSLSNRYVATVKSDNGIEYHLPLQLSNSIKDSNLMSNLEKAIPLLSRLDSREDTSREADKIVGSIGVFMTHEDFRSVEIVAKKDRESNNFYPAIQVESRKGDKSFKGISKVTSIKDIINTLEGLGVKNITPKFFKKSLNVDRRDVSPTEFVTPYTTGSVDMFVDFLPVVEEKSENTAEKEVDIVPEINYYSMSREDLLDAITELYLQDNKEEEIQVAEDALNELDKGRSKDNFSSFKRQGEYVEAPMIFEDAKNWISERLPDTIKVEQSNILFSNLLSNGIAWGKFKDRIITLSREAREGTQFHEAFHAVFRSFLDDTQINKVYSEASKKYAKDFDSKAIEDLRSIEGYENLPESKLYDIFLEEKLADSFENSIKSKSFLGTIFKEIRDFINWLLNNSSEIDTLFKEIDKGVFKNSSIVDNRFTNAATQPVYSVIPSVDAEKTENIINTVASDYLKILKEAPSSINVSSDTFINNILDKLLDYKVKLYNPRDYSDRGKKVVRDVVKERSIYSSPTSRSIIKEEVKKTLSSYSFITREVVEDLVDSSELSERVWDVSFTEVGGFDSVSKEIKQFIALTSYLTKDKFGNTVTSAIDFPTVYASIERNLSGVPEKNQLERLKYLAEDNEQVNAVYTKLKLTVPTLEKTNKEKSSGLLDYTNDEMFLNRFHKAFEKAPINYIQVLRDKSDGSYNVFEANRKDIKSVQVSKWSRNYDTLEPSLNRLKIREDINQLKKEFETGFNDTVIPLVEGIFSSLGVDLSKGYLKHSFGLYTDVEGNYVDNFSDIPPMSLDDVTQLESVIRKGDNPFEGSKGIRTRLLNIADNDSKFREDLFSTSFQDAKGKNRYSYVLPSHLVTRHKEVSDLLKDESSILNLQSDEYLRYNPFVYQGKEILTDIAHTGDIREEVNSGDTPQEGATFKDIDPRAMLINLYGLYSKQTRDTLGNLNAWFTPMVLESKSTSMSVKLPVTKGLFKSGEVTDKAVDLLYDTIFTQEFLRLNNVFDAKFKNKEFINLPFLNSTEIDEELNISRDGNTITKIDNVVNNPSVIKESIKKGIESEIKEHLNILEKEDIVKSNKGKYSNLLLPPDAGKSSSSIVDYVGDFFINDFINTTAYTQFIQGDLAKAKHSVDRVKRNGGEIAYGNSLGEGEYNVAYMSEDIQEIDGNKVDTDDAQVYATLNRWIDIQKRLGRSKESQKPLFEKLMKGIRLNEVETSNLDLISLKGVHYDGKRYHKMSVLPLTFELTSEVRGGKVVPLFGKEKLHNMRVFMENNSVDELVTLSASKLESDNAIDPKEFYEGTINEKYGEDKNYDVTKLENKYWRLQVENQSGKRSIINGTQKLQLIDAGLTGETKDSLSNSYEELLKDSRDQSFNFAMSLVDKVSNGKKDIKYFLKKLRDSVEESNGDDVMLEFLAELEGDMKYDSNIPHISAKYEELFLAHFNKGVLSQKVTGYKATLVSSAGYEVIRSTNGNVVDIDTYKSNPENYLEGTSLKEGFTTSRLRLHHDEGGELVYAEVAMPKLAASSFDVKIGDTVSDELLTMLGWRTPTQDYHSMIPFKVVEFLPEYYGDVIIAPSDITSLSGADYDIDSLYMQRKDFYLDEANSPVIYGKVTNLKDKFKEFTTWNRTNNKVIKSYVNDKLLNDSTYLKLSNRPNSNSQEISEIKEDYFIEAFQEFGLPSNLEEYKETPLESIGGIQNKMLDLEFEMLEDPSIRNNLFIPATMTTLDNAVETIFKGIKGSKEGSNIHNGLNGKFNSWKSNSTGKTNVGIVANANLVSAYLTKNNISHNFELSIDGSTYRSYGKRYEDDISIVNTKGKFVPVVNKDVRLKQDSLSTMVSSATDNAKERHASKLNFTSPVLAEISVGISLGMGITRMSLISSQPILEKLTELTTKTKSAISPKKIDVIKSLRSLYAVKGSPYKNTELTSELLIKSLELSKKSSLTENEKNEFNSIQLKVLNLFNTLSDISKFHTNVSNIIKINKGIDTEYSSIDKIKYSYDSIISDNSSESPEFNKLAFSIVNNPLTISNIQKVFKIDDISSKYFLSRTNFYSTTIESIKPSLSYFNSESKKEISKAFTSYLGIKWLDVRLRESNAGYSFKDLNSLLYPEQGSETLVESFNKLNNSNNPEFTSNPLVKFLTPVLNSSTADSNGFRDGFDKLEGDMRTKFSPKTTSKFLDGYEDLRTNENPIYRSFAKSLVRYLVVKDNLQFKSDSFIKFISPEVFQELANGYKVLNREFDFGMENKNSLGKSANYLINEFSELYLRHISNRNKLVKVSHDAITKSSSTTIYTGKNGKVTVSNTNGSKNSAKVFRLEFNDQMFIFKRISSTENQDSSYTNIYEEVDLFNNYSQLPYHMDIPTMEKINKVYKFLKIPETRSESRTDENNSFFNSSNEYLKEDLVNIPSSEVFITGKDQTVSEDSSILSDKFKDDISFPDNINPLKDIC